MILQSEIEDVHDMRVIEVTDDARLREEVRPFILLERDGENFDGRLRFEVDMLAQVDFREAALSQQREQAVVSELLFQAPAFHEGNAPFLPHVHQLQSLSTDEHSVFFAALQENRKRRMHEMAAGAFSTPV